MESDVHDSKPECLILDRMEDTRNSNEMTEFHNSVNYSPVVCNNNNNQDKKCGYCSATFASQQELVSHLKIHTFICIECDQTFFDDKALASHMTKHMKKKKWVCEFCNKIFSFRSLLEQHSRSHLGLKPFNCDKCGKQFSRLFNMQVHKRQHLANDSFDCSHCSKKFSHSSNLSRHLQRVHTTQMTHRCTLCPKDFPDLWSLNQHLNSHKIPEVAHTQTSLPCKFCQQTFTTVEELNHHLQTHTDRVHLPSKTYATFNSHNAYLQSHNKEWQYQCEICSKSFLTLADLNCHLKCHSDTDDKGYFCKLCSNQKFTSIKLLLKHQKSRHNGKSQFICEYCQKEFMFHSLLMQHLRKHTGEKPFCCPQCKKSFVRLSNMKMHLKRHRTENRLSEEEMIGLASIAIFEQQRENECNSLGWDGSLNLENSSSFVKESQESINGHSIPTALAVGQNASNEKADRNQTVTFEDLSLDQQVMPYDIYFSDTVNQTASQYQEEIPPISPLISPRPMYTNGGTDEKENENQATFQNMPLQCDSIFFLDIENQIGPNGQHRISPTPVKEPGIISVGAIDEETEKHNKDLNITENLPLGTHGYNLLNNQSVPSNQHEEPPTPLRELSVIPITSSSSNDVCAPQSRKDSYLINLETDLSSRRDNREDLSICQSFVNDNYMTAEQISTDAVAANNSRILQYLNSQTHELNLIKEVDQRNCLLDGATAVNANVSEISGSELIDLTQEINDTKTNLNFTCSYCGIVFLSSELLNDHMKLHTVTKPFVCGYCQKSFRYSSLLTQHIKVHRQHISSFRCNQCPKYFFTHNSLILHQQTHKKAHNKTKKALLDCGDCGQQFPNLQNLCHHKCVSTVNIFKKSDYVGDTRLEKTPENLQNEARKKINSLHTCQYCGKIFRFQSLLTQHLRRHTGEKPFNCPICQKSFARLFNLEVHHKLHLKKAQPPSKTQPPSKAQPSSNVKPSLTAQPSSNVQPLKAQPSSNVKSSSKEQPSSLLSTIHSLQQIIKVAANPVSDMLQPLSTVPLAKLSPTVKEETAKKKKFHRCNLCDQSFSLRNDLVKHRQQHKPFICEFCKKEFRFYSLLVQHLPTHTGEKIYNCHICQKSFARLFNLKTHQKNHHNKNRSEHTVDSVRRQ